MNKNKTFSAYDFFNTFQDQNVEVAPGIEYDYFQVLKENRASYHSKFLSGDVDSTGYKKTYFSLAYAYYRAKYDMIDLDFKDISIEALNSKGQHIANIFRGILKTYVSKANEFGEKPDKIINEVKEALLKDGVCYLKLVGDTAYVVDPFNIIEPPNREGLGTLIEKNEKLPLHLIEQKYSKIEDLPETEDIKKNQVELNKLIENAKENGENLIVYEYWVMDEVPYCQIFVTENRNEEKKGVLLGQSNDLGIMVAQFDSPILDQYGKPTFPYSKAHNIRVANRRGGFSIFELVKGIVEYNNKYLNDTLKADDLNMKNVYLFSQGRQQRKIPNNFLQRIKSNAILEMKNGEDLRPLPKTNITTNAVNFTSYISGLGREIAGVSGIDMMNQKSHVSATAIKGAQVASESAGNTTIENMSILLSDFVERLWAPAIFRKIIKDNKLLSFTGSLHELKQIDKYLVENEVYLEMYDIKNKFGFYGYYDENKNPIQLYTDEDIDKLVEDRLNSNLFKGTKRTTKITSKILKSMNYNVRFVIGAERENRDVKINNLMQMLQMSQNNPIITNKIHKQIAELMHVDPTLFDLTDQEKQMIMQQNSKLKVAPKGLENKVNQPLPVK